MIIHHHTIYQARVTSLSLKDASPEIFVSFLYELVREIGMEILIPPQVTLSKNNAWTGLVGIITSHVSFHYWVEEGYVQLDVYSCKEYSQKKLRLFLQKFWGSKEEHILMVDRKEHQPFSITEIK